MYTCRGLSRYRPKKSFYQLEVAGLPEEEEIKFVIARCARAETNTS